MRLIDRVEPSVDAVIAHVEERTNVDVPEPVTPPLQPEEAGG